MLIYLARHGETTGDVEDRYGGDYDDHLTEKGTERNADCRLCSSPFGMFERQI